MLITPLRGNEVHLWTAEVTPDLDPARFWPLLSPDERERANRYHLERDRVRFTIFRGVLRILLGQYLGRDPESIAFTYAAKGKPSVPGGGVDFNVSHSHNMAAYAFAGEELGLDIEWVRPDIEVEAIATRFFASDERAFILGSAHPVEAFFDCWTRKEAYIKAEGGGLSIPLNTFSVRGPLPWEVYSWRPAPGYFAAAAVIGRKSFHHRLFEGK
jgi:4'-phosphopantetheinyl transferase